MCVTKSGTSTAVVLKYLGFMCMTKSDTSTAVVLKCLGFMHIYIRVTLV